MSRVGLSDPKRGRRCVEDGDDVLGGQLVGRLGRGRVDPHQRDAQEQGKAFHDGTSSNSSGMILGVAANLFICSRR